MTTQRKTTARNDQFRRCRRRKGISVGIYVGILSKWIQKRTSKVNLLQQIMKKVMSTIKVFLCRFT